MNAGRILVVDDDDSTRLTLHDYFTSIGYKVEEARDGEEALKKFSPGKFDCIISDLCMPKVDGLELLKTIKLHDKSVYFLMITSHPTIDSAVNAVKEGAYDYLKKPFQMEEIRVKVEKALFAKKAAGSLNPITGLLWGLIISIPIWLFLGIILGIIWK